MTDPWNSWQFSLALFGAGGLFLLSLGLSVALASFATVTRVGLHRISNAGPARLEFLATIREPVSSYRMAAALMRILSLLAGLVLVLLALLGRGASPWTVLGSGGATLAGLLLLDLSMSQLFALWDVKSALRTTAPLVRFSRLALYPVVGPLSLLLSKIARAHEANEDESDEEQEEEVEALIEVGEREGILEGEEGEMMRSIVDLDETVVREIMTPRTDIVAVPVDTTAAMARRRILEAGHSRLPVYRESMDDVVGVLHERDLLRAWERGQDTLLIADYLREVMFVPETLSVADLLGEMRVKSHMALVLDEYGGVSGLVTLEDLLEQIVGEIREEHDDEEDPVQEQADGSWLINAAAHVDELEELFGLEFENRDFDTVGGLVVSVLGRVPAQGERVRVRTVEIEVLESDARRIRRVRVRPLRSSEAQA